MPFSSDVPAPVPYWPIEDYYPYTVPDGSIFGSNEPGIGDRQMGVAWPIRPGANNTIRLGSNGGTGTDRTFQRRAGKIGAGMRTTGAAACDWWAHPTLSQMPLSVDALDPFGWQNEESQRVAWWRLYWFIDAGGGALFTGDESGFYLLASDGGATTYNAAVLPTGATPRAICGLVGYDAGGIQGMRFRAWDAAGLVIDSVNLTPPLLGGFWQVIDFVIVAATDSRPAELRIHVGDAQSQLGPFVIRPFDGVNLLRPQDFSALAWGVGWGVSHFSPAVARWITFRWRLRGGKFLPDGQEIRQ